jgi:serine/threonine protein kinase
MYKLLKGVHYMHQKKCMHRDLKPSNILLKSKQSYADFVIGDFGLAQFIETKPIYQKCGTPGFVAPEVLNYSSGDPFYNEKCDIFSAGVIFYLLLTGKSIFGKGDL